MNVTVHSAHILKHSITLQQYVKKRNGLPLGASGSLKAMLKNAFGAPSFDIFWNYWNPIWGFYLSRYVMRPLNKYLYGPIAFILTFTLSGALHDVAVSLVKWEVVFLITPWFTLMGVIAYLFDGFHIRFHSAKFVTRSIINAAIIFASYAVMWWFCQEATELF
ncbi:acyltransferase [Pseudoalteromonas sp. SSDWG2]|uniref:acyltransferase n=1 Tax=Pseudoalteromonas sp. SSDWG2 TaxID=3139391 RepID=UPI003BABD88F